MPCQVQVSFRFHFLPISLFYFNVVLPNFKKLFLSLTSDRSKSVSLEVNFSIRLSNGFLSGDRPSSCGIFGYKPAASTVHEIILSGEVERERERERERK